MDLVELILVILFIAIIIEITPLSGIYEVLNMIFLKLPVNSQEIEKN